MHGSKFICVSVFRYTCMYVYMHVCMFDVGMNACMHLRVHVYMYKGIDKELGEQGPIKRYISRL